MTVAVWRKCDRDVGPIRDSTQSLVAQTSGTHRSIRPARPTGLRRARLLRRPPRPTAANTSRDQPSRQRVLGFSPAAVVLGATGPIDSSRLFETGWPGAR